MSLLLLIKTSGEAPVEAVAPQPSVARPILNNALSVSITTANGEAFRWGPDEWQAANIPQGVSFSTSIPGGFKACQITLPRRIDQDYPDLNLLDNVQVIGPGNEIFWEGRIAQLPRSHGDEFSVTVGAVGWSAHLMDDTTFREIYIDSDLSHWSEPSTKRLEELLTQNFSKELGWELGSAGTTGAPAIIFPYQRLTKNKTGWEARYYPNGIDIGKLKYNFKGPGEDTAWFDVAALAKTDLWGSSKQSSDYNAKEALEQTLETSESGFKYAFLQTYRENGESALDPYRGAHSWQYPKVIGTHGLTIQGTWPNVGVYASDVIANVISRAAPLLSTEIQATSFAIPQLAFLEPTTAQGVIELCNGYHLWDWAVWEGKKFTFTEPNSEVDWLVRLGDGAKVDLEGLQAEDVINSVLVSYTDAGGVGHTVGPPGSGAETTSSSLLDSSATNPINAHGIPRKTALLNISSPTSEEAAIQLGQVYLLEKAIPQRRGTLTLTGFVQHATAGMRPAAAVRAGEWVRIADHPADTARKIIETNYDASSETVTCSLDNTSHKLDAILERLGVQIMGVL